MELSFSQTLSAPPTSHTITVQSRKTTTVREGRPKRRASAGDPSYRNRVSEARGAVLAIPEQCPFPKRILRSPRQKPEFLRRLWGLSQQQNDPGSEFPVARRPLLESPASEIRSLRLIATWVRPLGPPTAGPSDPARH